MSRKDNKPESHEFDDVLARYGALVNKVCYFYASDIDDFNDLRQEALLNLWKALPGFRNESHLSTWIYRITLNSCVSFFRRNKHNHHADSIDRHPELIADDDEKASMIREMYALINKLDAIDKAIILMWLDGTDYATISSVIGMTKTTVGTRIHRIKDKLVELSNK